MNSGMPTLRSGFLQYCIWHMSQAWGLNEDVKLFYVLIVGEPSFFLENEHWDIFLNLLYFGGHNLKPYLSYKSKSSWIFESIPALKYLLAWIEVEVVITLKSKEPVEML